MKFQTVLVFVLRQGCSLPPDLSFTEVHHQIARQGAHVFFKGVGQPFFIPCMCVLKLDGIPAE